jgi:hypothetical protein
MTLAAHEASILLRRLTRASENTAFYVTLTAAEEMREIADGAGFNAGSSYRLIRVDHRLDTTDVEQFEIALVDDTELSVAYYDRITLEYLPEFSSRYFARNQAWRSASRRHSLALHDVSNKVLFGYIVQSYNLLMTQDAVSGCGQFYWHRQVSRAIEHGLHVYTYEVGEHTLRSIPSQTVLNDIASLGWSNTRQEPLQALISRSPLVRR